MASEIPQEHATTMSDDDECDSLEKKVAAARLEHDIVEREFLELISQATSTADLFKKYARRAKANAIRRLIVKQVSAFNNIEFDIYNTTISAQQQHEQLLATARSVCDAVRQELEYHGLPIGSERTLEPLNQFERLLFNRDIQGWGLFDLELARTMGLDVRASALQRLEMHLRAKELDKQTTYEANKSDNDESVTTSGSSDLDDTNDLDRELFPDRAPAIYDIRKALAQLRNIDEKLHVLMKPKLNMTTNEHVNVHDSAAVLLDIEKRMQEAKEQAGNQSLSKIDLDYESDDEERPIVMLKRMDLRMSWMMECVRYRKEKDGKAKESDRTMTEVYRRFINLWKTLTAVTDFNDHENDESGSAKTAVPEDGECSW